MWARYATLYSNIASAVVNEAEGWAIAGKSAIDWYIVDSGSEGAVVVEGPSRDNDDDLSLESVEGEVGTLGVSGRWSGFFDVHLVR